MWKKCNMLEIILVQGFCPLKIKTTQFPNGSHLKYNEVQLSPSSKLISYQSWNLLNQLMSRKQYPFLGQYKFTLFLIILTRFIILWADFCFYVQRWISLGNYRYFGLKKKKRNKGGVSNTINVTAHLIKKKLCSNYISKFCVGSVGAARKVSRNCLQEKWHSFNCFSIVWGRG